MARKSGRGRAKGGGAGKTRQYVRDSNGRFASTPGGGKKAAAKPAARPKAKPAAKTPAKPKAPPKTTTARGRARARAAEARKALRAGAGTRAARSLAIAQKAADYYKATGTGTKRKPTRAAAKPTRERAGAKPATRTAATSARAAQPSLAERKRANALRRGIIRQTTDAERRQRAQNLATAERALANIRANPPRNAFGLDRNAIRMAEARVEGLRGPMPDFRRVDRSSIRQAARDRLAIRRSAKQSAKVMRSQQTARKAAAWYQETGTLPASMRKKAKRRGGAKPATKAKSAPSKPAKSRGSGQRLKPPPKQFLLGQVTRPGSKPASPTTLDEARWRRIAQRVQTRGEVRALIESNRPGGLNQATEKRVFAAYATRQRAEAFLRNLVTKPAAPGSMRRVPVSGLSELNQGFAARKVGGTGSTFVGVAARNRIYDEAQRAKRAARKAARAAGTPAASKGRRRKR